MTSQQLQQLFEDFTDTKILVVGDIMTDAYLWGNVSRISPEAPVPVVSVTREESRPGGAANVALNLKSLGAYPIPCGVIGDDDAGRSLLQLIAQLNIDTSGIIETGGRKTTVKTRVIGNNHQLLRVDSESEQDIDQVVEQRMLDRIDEIVRNNDIRAIIFQDYNKGLLTEKLIKGIIAQAKSAGIPTAVDPKKRNFWAYEGVTLFKPNLKELSDGLKTDFDKTDQAGVTDACKQLMQRLQCEQVLLTLSEQGVMVYNGEQSLLYPAHIRNIADVSGAGDTVISVAALCLGLQTGMEAIAWLSNLAGGLVCEHIGVVPVKKEELYNEALELIRVS